MAQKVGSGSNVGVSLTRGAGQAATLAATAAEAKFLALSETLEFAYFPYFYADGATDYALDVTLPRNALVGQLDVVVTAARAFSVQAQVVAQVRTASISGGKSVVLDFGTLRTVSAVTLPVGFTVQRLSIWNGMEFSTRNLVPHGTTGGHIALTSEVRTERLMIEAAGAGSADSLATGILLVLPDAPSDLELRIDGGAPVWIHSGPAQAGGASTIDEASFNEEGKRLVRLGPAFASLVGDPTASGDQAFELKLTSVTAGRLKLDLQDQSLRLIHRATFDGAGVRDVAVDQEGAIDLVPAAPGAASAGSIEEIRLRIEGDFEDERILPPVGPDPSDLLTIDLAPERSVLFRLLGGSGLELLNGLRLPLAAASGGAELRVVLWTNKGAGYLQPVEALAGASSEPVSLQPAADLAPAWTTFRFAKPVPLDAANPPWAAIVVTRGAAAWTLAASTGASDPLDGAVIRFGPPSGPWRGPPPVFDVAPFAALRARFRMIGTAPENAPIAPLELALVDGASGEIAGSVESTPVAAGSDVTVIADSGSLGAASPRLRLVARAHGSLTLRSADIVTGA